MLLSIKHFRFVTAIAEMSMLYTFIRYAGKIKH